MMCNAYEGKSGKQIQILCASTALGMPSKGQQGFHTLEFEIQNGHLIGKVEVANYCIDSQEFVIEPCS